RTYFSSSCRSRSSCVRLAASACPIRTVSSAWACSAVASAASYARPTRSISGVSRPAGADGAPRGCRHRGAGGGPPAPPEPLPRGGGGRPGLLRRDELRRELLGLVGP